MMTPSQVVILGNTGFIGKAIFDYYQESDSNRISGFSSSKIDLRFPDSVAPLAEIVNDRTTLLVVSGVTTDQTSDSLNHFTTNAAIAVNIARFLIKHPVKKCVYFSTVSVYGDRRTNLSINEATSVEPVTYYATAKYAGESILQKSALVRGFPLLILRLCRVYGAGAIHANYGPAQFVRSILEDSRVDLYGEGKELRDHLYIGDLVRIVHHLTGGEFVGIYNVASGKSRSFLEIISCLKSIVSQEFHVSQLPRTRPLIDQQFDIRKLTQAMPDFRFTALREGLKTTYDYFLKASLNRV